MSERCIKKDKNHRDNKILTSVALTITALLFVLSGYMWWVGEDILISIILLLSTMFVMMFGAIYCDKLDRRFIGIGYHEKKLSTDGVNLSYNTRSYDNHVHIFERYLTREGLEYTKLSVSILSSVITVVLKRDIDYLKLVECVEASESEIRQMMIKEKLFDEDAKKERKRLELNAKLLDEKNAERYCKKI